MVDVVMGVLALLIGLLLCFRGRGAMRVLLALWGAFVGFGLGASLVAGLTEHGYLATAAGWLAAIVLAIVFAVLAYLFFAVAVVLVLALAMLPNGMLVEHDFAPGELEQLLLMEPA